MPNSVGSRNWNGAGDDNDNDNDRLARLLLTGTGLEVVTLDCW